MSTATQIVHWPGKDSPMCDRHAEQAKRVGAAMGIFISCSVILLAAEEMACKNCENEANVSRT